MRSNPPKVVISWLKAAGILLFLSGVGYLSPKGTMDPWGIFAPRKIILLIFALVFIQLLAELSVGILGNRRGSLLAGFFGGLVSSTALTASLARQSRKVPLEDETNLMVTFVSGTLAMVCEGLFLLVMGTEEFHSGLLFVFLGPLLLCVFWLYLHSKRQMRGAFHPPQEVHLEILPLLKLALFILGILALSKWLQVTLGQVGLLPLTFLASLFEIHGSIIANVQLHDSQVISVGMLGALLAVALGAATLSKVFLMFTLGSRTLFHRVLRFAVGIGLSLVVGGGLFAGWFSLS